MHNPSLQAALHALQAHPTLRVAFLMDQDGALCGWSGASPGFSPVGQFPPRAEDAPKDENLYLTVLAGAYFLGVIFEEGVAIDAVRALVARHEQALLASLGL